MISYQHGVSLVIPALQRWGQEDYPWLQSDFDASMCYFTCLKTTKKKGMVCFLNVYKCLLSSYSLSKCCFVKVIKN